MTRGRWPTLALLLAAVAAGCAAPVAERGPSAVTPLEPEGRRVDQASRPGAVGSGSTRATSCPLPPRVEGGYNLAQLPLFSKTLFYLRENHPQGVDQRARELLVGALEAVALQEREIVVERDSAASPRWVTVTFNEQRCTLNLERVDAPWSLRSGLQDALRFVQGHLGQAPAVVSPERLMRIEIAATNGMLTALDGTSQLLDAETYRTMRAGLPKGPNRPRADTAAIHPQESPPSAAVKPAVSASSRRAAPGLTVGYLRLENFGPGVSGDVEHELAGFEAQRVKGLVLDLRDNTGGLLDEAIKVADAFIKDGTLGSIAGKQQRKEVVARNGGNEPAGALVVLVNRRTAAASELVAAAVKNLGRGVILGEPTAGAGSIRVVFDIQQAPPRANDEPLGLLLMTGRLLAAGGDEIQAAGVIPDVDPPCPAAEKPRPKEDCLLELAQATVIQARDAQRLTLLSTAKAIAGATRP